jgi:hypothetical protein
MIGRSPRGVFNAKFSGRGTRLGGVPAMGDVALVLLGDCGGVVNASGMVNGSVEEVGVFDEAEGTLDLSAGW